MDKFIKNILDENIKINSLYESINKKLQSQDKKLKFIIEVRGNGELGKTYNYINEVIISMDLKLKENKEKFIAVFIHELGEADYIANELPVIYKLNGEFYGDFTECITHSHINKIVEKYNLNDYILPIMCNSNNLNDTNSEFVNIINLLHHKITYNLNDEAMYNKADFYLLYKNIINKSINIIENINTIDVKKEDVIKAENKCLKLIKEINKVSNCNTIEVRSKLKETVFFNDEKIKFKLDIDKEICRKIYANIDEFDNIKSSIDCNTLEVKGFFTDELKINDVYRYKVSFKSGYPKFTDINNNKSTDMEIKKYNDYTITYQKKIKSIVIILESPHSSEYFKKDNKLIIKGPAQGDTGKRIHENILMLLNELSVNNGYNFNNGEYRIILINSISYQTSLYALHGQGLSSDKKYSDLRDKIWREIWKKEFIKKSLKDRIKDANPYLIINACTKVGQKEVRNILNEENYENIVETNHPCNWKGFGIKKLK